MCFKAFYTSIYNIHLGFIKIERKTGREEVRTKFAKKTSSPRQRGRLSEGVRLSKASLRLGGADMGHKTYLRFA